MMAVNWPVVFHPVGAKICALSVAAWPTSAPPFVTRFGLITAADAAAAPRSASASAPKLSTTVVSVASLLRMLSPFDRGPVPCGSRDFGPVQDSRLLPVRTPL